MSMRAVGAGAGVVRVCTWMWLAIWVALGVGCGASVESIQRTLEERHAQGDYAGAGALLDDVKTREVYGDRDLVLWSLERGATHLACCDYDGARTTLDKAETYTAYNYDRTAAEVLAQWSINDAAAAYAAQPYEDLYVNVMKQVAFLAGGDLNNAAAESRRLMDKSKSLGGYMAQYIRELQAGDASGFVTKYSDNYTPTSSEQEYVTSPLGAYLAALIAAKNDNASGLSEAGIRLRQSLGEQRAFNGAVDASKFDAIDTVSPGSFNVVVVAFSGRGPVKESRDIEVPFTEGMRLDIPFPMIRRRPSSAVTGARVEFEGGATQELDLVEDLGQVVAENFARTERVTYIRTLARIGLKAGIVAGASYGVAVSTKSEFWTSITVLAGVAYIALTEEADLRSWVMLPGQARVGTVLAPDGARRARIVYTLPGGGVRTTAWQEINVGGTAPGVVVGHVPD